jgi:hypothetical protein
MTPKSYNNAQHWRDRAAEMRALAVTMQDVNAAATVLRLAADYDKLADRANVRTQDSVLPGGI